MNHKKAPFLLVGLGELLWDLLPSGPQLGGAPANFAYHAQALGGRARMVSCIGPDEWGQKAVAQLNTFGLDTAFVATDAHAPTGTVTVELDAQGKPVYTIHENVAWDRIAWTDALADLAASCDAVCFGSLAQRSEPSRQTIQRFLGHTSAQCLRIFDINLRQSYYDADCIGASLTHANVFKLSDEEVSATAACLQMSDSEDAFLDELLKRYDLQLIALTRGAQGSRLKTPAEDRECASLSVQIADTVGAGDAFTAALGLGLLKHQDLETIHTNATQLAGYVCSQPGAMPEHK
ncbi:MAG: carbohydrate kinase [Chloroflexi bacterium]|nr:carbohydrate kinase [Chloroflexota bacterium]